MPTYEYRREDGTTFEVFQRISEDPLTVDPETGQKVSRVIGGGAGLIFKGSGFYLTDYARKGANGDQAAAKPDAKADAKSESRASSESGDAPAKSTANTTSSPDD